MVKKTYASRITILFIALAVMLSSIIFAFINNNEYAFSDAETSSDAGVYSIKDDFRFNGLTVGKDTRYFYSYSGVKTGEYGDYEKGLYPESTGGYLLYRFNLDGNGLFIHFRTLKLITTQNFNGGSISVFYTIDSEENDYTELNTYNSDLSSETDFGEILSSVDKNSTFLFVKINLIGANLFTVRFDGMMNFVMKNGACIRETSYTSVGDLKFRAFIATDCYEIIKEEFSSFSLGVLILPTDFFFEETKNASFEWGKVRYVKGAPNLGEANNPFVLKDRSLLGGENPLTVTVNGVSYYYYDGIIRLHEQYLTRQLTCKAYISSTVNGEKKVVALASFYNQRIENNSRSVSYIAIKTLENNTDEILADRLNKLYLDNISSEWEKTVYTVRKFYIDDNYNVIDVKITDYKDLNVNEKVFLTEKMRESDKTGFSLVNKEIRDGDTVIYRNTVFDRTYPIYTNKNYDFVLQNQKLVIDLFFTAN